MPQLPYVVGVRNPYLAIGTSARTVSFNAFANLIAHAPASHARWKVAFILAAVGVFGAFVGSSIGKVVNANICWCCSRW